MIRLSRQRIRAILGRSCVAAAVTLPLMMQAVADEAVAPPIDPGYIPAPPYCPPPQPNCGPVPYVAPLEPRRETFAERFRSFKRRCSWKNSTTHCNKMYWDASPYWIANHGYHPTMWRRGACEPGLDPYAPACELTEGVCPPPEHVVIPPGPDPTDAEYSPKSAPPTGEKSAPPVELEAPVPNALPAPQVQPQTSVRRSARSPESRTETASTGNAGPAANRRQPVALGLDHTSDEAHVEALPGDRIGESRARSSSLQPEKQPKPTVSSEPARLAAPAPGRGQASQGPGSALTTSKATDAEAEVAQHLAQSASAVNQPAERRAPIDSQVVSAEEPDAVRGWKAHRQARLASRETDKRLESTAASPSPETAGSASEQYPGVGGRALCVLEASSSPGWVATSRSMSARGVQSNLSEDCTDADSVVCNLPAGFVNKEPEASTADRSGPVPQQLELPYDAVADGRVPPASPSVTSEEAASGWRPTRNQLSHTVSKRAIQSDEAPEAVAASNSRAVRRVEDLPAAPPQQVHSQAVGPALASGIDALSSNVRSLSTATMFVECEPAVFPIRSAGPRGTGPAKPSTERATSGSLASARRASETEARRQSDAATSRGSSAGSPGGSNVESRRSASHLEDSRTPSASCSLAGTVIQGPTGAQALALTLADSAAMVDRRFPEVEPRVFPLTIARPISDISQVSAEATRPAEDPEAAARVDVQTADSLAPASAAEDTGPASVEVIGL